MKLELSHMPRLDEEVALICSATSKADLDSAVVRFWFSDTINVEVVKGKKFSYCTFKKDETREFRLTVIFQEEGSFRLAARASPLPAGWGSSTHLIVKTYEDKEAVLLESMPWKLPKYIVVDPRRPELRDSIEAVIGSLRVIQR